MNYVKMIIALLTNKQVTTLSLTERIANLDYSEVAIPKLYDMFNSIKGQLPIVKIKVLGDCHIFRQRRNERNQEFKCINELSYPPVTAVKNYGRINIPGKPMFYGCSFGNYQPTEIPIKASVMEVSELVKNSNLFGIERTTCSVWKVVNQINLLAFPFSENYKNPTNDIMRIQKEYKAFKNSIVSKENLSLMQYMSNEIAKSTDDNLGYVKIAHFVNFLLNKQTPTESYDGILYPSVYAQGNGYNVALKPCVVDNNLQFVSAHCCYLVKRPENPKELDVDFVSHSVGQNDRGELAFEQDEDFDVNKYAGLPFIN